MARRHSGEAEQIQGAKSFCFTTLVPHRHSIVWDTGVGGGEGSFYFPPRINLPNFLFIPSSSAAIHPHRHHLFDRSARSTATNNYRITNNNLLCQKREGVQNPRMRRAMTRGFPPSLRQLEVKWMVLVADLADCGSNQMENGRRNNMVIKRLWALTWIIRYLLWSVSGWGRETDRKSEPFAGHLGSRKES